MSNKPEVLMEGVETPVGTVAYAAVDAERPLDKMTKKDSTELIAPHNKVQLVVDDTTAEFLAFEEKIESVGVNKSLTPLIKDNKKVKGFKRITAKTFSVKDFSSIFVLKTDGTVVKSDEKFINASIGDKVKAHAVVKVIRYPNHDTLTLELEGLILHEVEMAPREQGKMSEKAAEIAARYQTVSTSTTV